MQKDLHTHKLDYGVKLLNASDRLIGSKMNKLISLEMEEGSKIKKSSLLRKILLKVYENIDDIQEIQTKDLITILDLLDSHGLPEEIDETLDKNEIFKEVYLELLENRPHLLTDEMVR